MSIELETPLVGLHTGTGAALARGTPDRVQLTEQMGVALVNLRADPADSALLRLLQARLGLDLPVAPNTVSQGGGLTAFWLAPDEWLLMGDAGSDALVAQIEQLLAGHRFAVTDQSSGYSVVRLQGPEARDVLNAGCPLDLHPRALTLGQCAQSHFFKAAVLLRPLDAQGQAWELTVRRSFADYTARMLMDAMQG